MTDPGVIRTVMHATRAGMTGMVMRMIAGTIQQETIIMQGTIENIAMTGIADIPIRPIHRVAIASGIIFHRIIPSAILIVNRPRAHRQHRVAGVHG